MQKNELMASFSLLLFQAMRKSNSSSVLKLNDKQSIEADDKK